MLSEKRYLPIGWRNRDPITSLGCFLVHSRASKSRAVLSVNNAIATAAHESETATYCADLQYQEVEQLIALFNQTFADTNSRLVRGIGEPIYLPADETTAYHRIEFAHGFFNSALHEIAHWCIAGTERRKLEDYGYWYCPDGRTADQQQAFEQVEIKPQALEWAFSVAARREFGVSTDNLNGVTPDRTDFALRVYAQLEAFLATKFPPRAQLFIQALQAHYKSAPLTAQRCLSASKDLSS